jgi:hypothetical protein
MPYCTPMGGAPSMPYAGLPGFGRPFGSPALAYGGFPMMPMIGGPDLGVMRPDLAALALVGATGPGGYPALVASPSLPRFPGQGGLPGLGGVPALAWMMPAYGPYPGFGPGGQGLNPAFAQAFHPAFAGFPAYAGLPAFGGVPAFGGLPHPWLAFGYPIAIDPAQAPAQPPALPAQPAATAAAAGTGQALNPSTHAAAD